MGGRTRGGPGSGPEPLRLSAHTENKLEKNEEAALLSWEIYLKENYLQNQQYQQKQRTEQKIQDISNRYGRHGTGHVVLRRAERVALVGEAQELVTWDGKPPCCGPSSSTSTGPVSSS